MTSTWLGRSSILVAPPFWPASSEHSPVKFSEEAAGGRRSAPDEQALCDDRNGFGVLRQGSRNMVLNRPPCILRWRERLPSCKRRAYRRFQCARRASLTTRCPSR